MKLLRIVSDGTAAGTNFEVFDPETGKIEPVELPVRRIKWTLDEFGIAEMRLDFTMPSLNIMQPTEGIVNRIDEQLARLLKLRESLLG